MINRKQAKIITTDDFLSQQSDKNRVSCDIEDVLCKDYVYILDAMDMEDFEYEDTSFDIFKEIVFKNKVVGFVSYMNKRNGLLLMEAYIMPEYRGNNLLYDEISSKSNLRIRKPKIDFVKSLIDCNLATELSEGVVVSEIPFNVSTFELTKDIGMGDYYSYVYDLDNGSVLFLERETDFCYSRPNRNDKGKYNLSSKIDDSRLNKVYEIVSDYDKKYLKVLHEKAEPTIVFT